MAFLLSGWRFWATLALFASIAGGLAWWRHDIAATATAGLRAEIAGANEKRRREVADYVADMSARNTALAGELRAERGRVKTETQVLKEKVPTYVTPAADRACVVPRGFVLHHDAAWSGRPAPVPATAGGPVDAPSGVPLSRVADVNADNAGACRELRTEVEYWRRWYPARREEYERLRAHQPAPPAAAPHPRGAEGQPEALPRKER